MNNRAHYLGEPVTAEAALKCVLYEAFTLAICIQALQSNSWPRDGKYKVPGGTFDVREVLKHSALMKIRTLDDFFHKRGGKDDITFDFHFSHFKISKPVPHLIRGPNSLVPSRESIDKFVAHLTETRIEKPRCKPQAKFATGSQQTVDIAKKYLRDVLEMAKQLKIHRGFKGLDDWGSSYFNGLRKAVRSLK